MNYITYRYKLSKLNCKRKYFERSILKDIKDKFPDADMQAKKTLQVAVMGCEVNGPGEARNADLGIAFAGIKAIYFEKGKIVKTITRKDALKFLTNRIKRALK